MARRFAVEAMVRVIVTVNDENVIRRVVENHDDQGVPQPDIEGGTGWRNYLYQIETEEGVIEHLAYNAIRNGETDAHRLDGWADLPRGAVDMQIEDVEFEGVDEVPA